MKTDLKQLTISELKDYLELALKTHEFLVRQLRINNIVLEKDIPPLYKKMNKVIDLLRDEIEERLLALINE